MSYRHLILKFSEKDVRFVKSVKLFPLNSSAEKGNQLGKLIAELGPVKYIEVKGAFNCTRRCKSNMKEGKVLHLGIKLCYK